MLTDPTTAGGSERGGAIERAYDRRIASGEGRPESPAVVVDTLHALAEIVAAVQKSRARDVALGRPSGVAAHGNGDRYRQARRDFAVAKAPRNLWRLVGAR